MSIISCIKGLFRPHTFKIRILHNSAATVHKAAGFAKYDPCKVTPVMVLKFLKERSGKVYFEVFNPYEAIETEAGTGAIIFFTTGKYKILKFKYYE